MTFRFPDKPTTTSAGALPAFKDGMWVAQMKYDGWRTYLAWDGHKLELTSRQQTPIPATTRLLDAMREVLTPCRPMLLDAEWMGRRDNQPEYLWVFDILSLSGEWLGGLTTAERWHKLWVEFAPATHGYGDFVNIPEFAEKGYGEFFELSKHRPGCEGIVLKHREAKFIGSVRKSVDNPMWFKVKWRDGADGQVLVA